MFLPSVWKFSGNPPRELGMLIGELLPVLRQKCNPILFELRSTLCDLGICGGRLLGNLVLGLWIETELGLDVDNVVGLECCDMFKL